MRAKYISLFAFGFTLAIGGCLDADEPGNLVPKTVDEDPSLPAIDLPGTKLHAEVFGSETAPVIVVLHGGPGHDYRGLLGLRNPIDGVRLEDRHRVVFFDQRGCGLSRRHDGDEMTIEKYEEDLTAILERFSPGRPVVLLAKSWGAMYGSWYIGRHPDRIAGAVLMEPGPLTGTLFEDVKGGIQKIDLGSEWLNDFTWSQTIVSPDDHARADYALMVGKFGDSQPGFHEATENREPFWRLGALANSKLQKDSMKNGKPDWDFTIGLSSFQRPALFIASERNEVIGAEFQRRQMQFYPNAELATVSNTGHDLVWVQPDATLRHIFSYLAKIGF